MANASNPQPVRDDHESAPEQAAVSARGAVTMVVVLLAIAG